MRERETIRSLQRGLEVLKVLQSNPSRRWHDIHVATAISKPSLLRILNTLRTGGRRFAPPRRRPVPAEHVHTNRRETAIVRSGRRGGRARAGPALPKSINGRPICSSRPATTCNDGRLSLAQTLSLSIRAPQSTRSDTVRANWLLTGVGRAYLAYCPDKERDAISGGCASPRNLRTTSHTIQDGSSGILAETRQRGYASATEFSSAGHYNRPPFDDGLAAIAVPLLRSGARARIDQHISSDEDGLSRCQEFAARHFADLRAAAREIVASLHGPTKRQ